MSDWREGTAYEHESHDFESKLNTLIRKEVNDHEQLSEDELINRISKVSSALIYKLATLTAILSAGSTRERCLEGADLMSKMLRDEALSRFDLLSK